jgi:hypothetical protein
MCYKIKYLQTWIFQERTPDFNVDYYIHVQFDGP